MRVVGQYVRCFHVLAEVIFCSISSLLVSVTQVKAEASSKNMHGNGNVKQKIRHQLNKNKTIGSLKAINS